MDLNQNFRFDCIQDAAHINSTIRRLQFQPYPTDQIEQLMWAYMMKQLKTLRDSLLVQGLNGISPGYDKNQTNPVAVAKEIINDPTPT